MFDTLSSLDTQLFLWINSHHTPALDWIMWTLSQHWCWAVVLVLVFGLLTLRYEPRRWWLVLAGIVFCFLLADQGSVHLFKETVCRLRPCHALENVRMFRTNCGGQYGFVSSHAANAFSIVTFIVLRYHKRMLATFLLVLWALLTCYSRAYLGKHYPGDLLCGALFGIIVGLLIGFFVNKMEKSCTKM